MSFGFSLSYIRISILIYLIDFISAKNELRWETRLFFYLSAFLIQFSDKKAKDGVLLDIYNHKKQNNNIN